MKKKNFTRPVCLMLSNEMYQRIAEITDQREISVSDYIRSAIQQILGKKISDNIIEHGRIEL